MKNRIDSKLIHHSAELLAKAKKIAIVPHFSPDGDAIGASLALFQYLQKKGKNVKIISSDAPPDFLNWLPKTKEILTSSKDKQLAQKALKSSDLIFVVDHNSFSRSGNLKEVLTDLHTSKIMIDHHPGPEPIANVMISYPSMCASCELMYEFIEALGDTELIDADIAKCLYTGIITDTGGLSYNSSNPKTYLIVSHLLSFGINKSKIHSNIYDNFSPNRMQLLGHCLVNGLEVLPQYQTAIIALKNEDLRKFNSRDGDTEGFVNYPLSIQKILISVIFIEQEELVKISFRSKGNVPINELASKHFNGGGHMNAAGGRTSENLNEAINRFKKLLPQFYKKHSNSQA